MKAGGQLRRWRRAAAPAIKSAFLHGGVYGALRRLRPSRQIAILRYHAVCGPEGYSYADPTICVTPEAFARQIRYLAAHYRVLPLPDIVAALRAGRELPVNVVAITFDDGYADNLSAARALHAAGLSATFYLTAACLAGGEPFWLAELRALVTAIRASAVRVVANGTELELGLADGPARQRAIRQLTGLLKRHPIEVREDVRRQLRAVAGPVAGASPMLSWREVAELHRLGMTIGAHTLTHPNLPSAGLEAARLEITGSRTLLERTLGIPVTMFSYPNGGAERYITPELQTMVREAGFEAATTSTNGFAGRASDLYALERIQVAERLEDLVFALEVERFIFAPRPRPIR